MHVSRHIIDKDRYLKAYAGVITISLERKHVQIPIILVICSTFPHCNVSTSFLSIASKLKWLTYSPAVVKEKSPCSRTLSAS
ncbi:hypothetical protein GKR41_00155 [Candidatus Vallotia lariciata]|nr:hypothetical protein GKR41_00155 [Candidatus Vallotia lariciata]